MLNAGIITSVIDHNRPCAAPPTTQVAQRWKFLSKPVAYKSGARTKAEVLPNARLTDLGRLLSVKGYQIFVKDGCMYAFKGLAGRLGPIGVHVALLLVLFGTAYSGFGVLTGSAMCPEVSPRWISSATLLLDSIARQSRAAWRLEVPCCALACR